MPWLPGPNPFPGHLGQATFSEIEWEVLEQNPQVFWSRPWS